MVLKRTTMDQLRSNPTGHINIRFRKELIEQGVVLSSEYHRTSVDCGEDIDLQISAVNAHLAVLGDDPIKVSDIAQAKAHAAQRWTPEVVANARAENARNKPKLRGQP